MVRFSRPNSVTGSAALSAASSLTRDRRRPAKCPPAQDERAVPGSPPLDGDSELLHRRLHAVRLHRWGAQITGPALFCTPLPSLPVHDQVDATLSMGDGP